MFARNKRTTVRMMSIRDIVNGFGGIRSAGRVLAKPPSTVSSWLKRNSIPAKLHLAIVEAAREHGFEVTCEDIARACAAPEDAA